MENIYESSNPRQKQVKYRINSNGCFICTSHKTDTSGYASGQREGKHVKIHRYYYEKKYGKLPKNIFLLHICDDRKCISLEHLTPGTHQENMNDMVNKGRSAKGERVASSKLTKAQVAVIRRSKLSTSELAEKYKVHRSTINRVKNRTYWT